MRDTMMKVQTENDIRIEIEDDRIKANVRVKSIVEKLEIEYYGYTKKRNYIQELL